MLRVSEDRKKEKKRKEKEAMWHASDAEMGIEGGAPEPSPIAWCEEAGAIDMEWPAGMAEVGRAATAETSVVGEIRPC